MKKKALILVTVLLLLFTTGVGVFASSNKLSYGLDVIANDMEIAKSGTLGREVSFKAEDFEEALGVNKIASITILTLPEGECGELRLSGIPVMKNQIISRKSIEKLKFIPTGENGFETSFVAGSVSTSQPLAIKCKITIANADGSAPEVEDAEKLEGVETIEGVACYSYLAKGGAPEDVMRYRIISYPENGTIKLIDASGGYYCYKPIEGFTGKDSFTYIVTDEFGKNPKEMTVEIDVRESLTDIKYFDMDENSAHLAAMILAERGILTADTVCGVSYFNPEGKVRRDEFLAMVMKAAGVEVEYNPKAKTAFADDSSIPEHLKSYIAYAEEKGYVTGMKLKGDTVFSPATNITTAQAALMIYNILEMEPTGECEVFADGDSIPDWAKEALATTASAGIIDTNSYNGHSSAITRAEAAQMLLSVLEYCEKQ